MFIVGQLVLCVDNSKAWPLKKNGIYTVGRVWDAYIDVAELPPEIAGGWYQTRFRPLTDISIFTAMLTKAPKTVEVDA